MFDPRSNRIRRIAAAVGAGTVLSFGLLACGDDDEGDEGGDGGDAAASAEEVTVTAVEYEFDLSATPSAETTSVTFDNQGKEQHALIFARINEGYTVDEAIEAEGEKGTAELIAQTDAKPGKSATVEVEGPLEPGSYAMLCPIGGPEGAHYELGQLEEFEIE